MSHREAQKIVNEVDAELGISLVAYQRHELEFLKNRLEEFLDLDVDVDELSDADDYRDEFGEEDEEEEND